MLKIGLTGGIGTGKSVAAKMFSLLGVPVYNADERARVLLDTDSALKNRLTELLGAEVLNPEGKPDRRIIAGRVFGNPQLLEKLNALIHPEVKKDFEAWCIQKQQAPYIIKEAAILFESGANEGLDDVILVEAPIDIRIERIIKRDKRSLEEINAIMERQWPDHEKRSRCAYHILNDGRKAIIPQVIQIDRELNERSIKSNEQTRTA